MRRARLAEQRAPGWRDLGVDAPPVVLALFALAISAFGIGTTELIINGLLPELAADFSVTIPAAGLLVSGYALGVAVGGPPLTMLGGRLSRKTGCR
ncbi:hypothetical protein ACFLIM_09635 [Nonomuraea sp. M3C6]|uniref:Major facilitator superfamily (MFS) profile domain-containing protein n=1 Tax=Nonomuraea marmarensis TaxID=3351344 RepID=A0ABW7A804_9ACTN